MDLFTSFFPSDEWLITINYKSESMKGDLLLKKAEDSMIKTGSIGVIILGVNMGELTCKPHAMANIRYPHSGTWMEIFFDSKLYIKVADDDFIADVEELGKEFFPLFYLNGEVEIVNTKGSAIKDYIADVVIFNKRWCERIISINPTFTIKNIHFLDHKVSLLHEVPLNYK